MYPPPPSEENYARTLRLYHRNNIYYFYGLYETTTVNFSNKTKGVLINIANNQILHMLTIV